jgi:hypothetical protein
MFLAMTATRKARKELSLVEKREMISLNDGDMTHGDIAAMFGCERSTVCKIVKERAKVEEGSQRARGGRHKQLEDALFEWLSTKYALNQTVPSSIIQGQALVLARKLGLPSEFKASDHWLYNFMDRHNLVNVQLHGEGGSVDTRVIEESRVVLRAKCRNFSPDDIYNADETGLYYKLLPRRSVVLRDLATSMRGKKLLKDRITLLLCTNASGTRKMIPWAVGYAKKPRCLKGRPNLPVKYVASQSAWMTAQIMRMFLMEFDNFVQRKSLLFLDNFRGHEKAMEGLSLRNVTVEFLPPNTTSALQPLDCGIISTLKSYYRKFLACKVLAEDLQAKEITLFDASVILANSWSNVTSETIVNCWNKAGILPNVIPSGVSDDAASEELAEVLDQLQSSLNAEELIGIDNALDSSLLHSNAIDFLEETVEQAHASSVNNNTTTDSSGDQTATTSNPEEQTHDIKKCCECLDYICHFQFQECDVYTEEERRMIHNILERTRRALRSQEARQRMITDFFQVDPPRFWNE